MKISAAYLSIIAGTFVGLIVGANYIRAAAITIKSPLLENRVLYPRAEVEDSRTAALFALDRILADLDPAVTIAPVLGEVAGDAEAGFAKRGDPLWEVRLVSRQTSRLVCTVHVNARSGATRVTTQTGKQSTRCGLNEPRT
jgi:hypothetical protein